MMHHSLLLRGSLLTAALSAGLVAQGRFLDLPAGAGTAYAVSDDGTYVAGTGPSDTFRWSEAGGIQLLNMVPIGRVDLSADGSVVMSNMRGSVSPNGLNEGAFWTQAAGWTNISGIAGSNCSGTLSTAYAMSKDGKTIVGLAWVACAARAFKWDAQNGMVDLGLFATHFQASARANTVAGDGSVVGGWEEATNGLRRAAVWFPIGTTHSEMLIIPPSPGNPEGAGEVWGMNHNGSVIVGEETDGEAWRWKGGVFESLGGFPGSRGGDTGSAQATNADGSMIVGVSGSALTGFGVFMWTEEDGMQRMEDFLADQGISIPAGPELTWASDISPSGYHIVGRRGDFRNLPVGEIAFWVELPAGVRYGVRHGGNNTMRLTGTGSTGLGGTLTVTTDRITAATPVISTLVGLGSTRAPLFGGTLLVDLSQPHVVVTGSHSGGASAFNITIPNDPSAVGASFFMQSVVVDPGAGGLVYSNGLKATVTR